MHNNLKTLGQEIRQARENKNIDRRHLSDLTKISTSAIQKIENGQFGFLPVVYIRAFLKSLAKEIGLDPNVMLQKYDKATGQPEVAHDPAPGQKKEHKTSPGVDFTIDTKTMGIAVVAGLFVIIVVFIFFNLPQKQKQAVQSVAEVTQPIVTKADTLKKRPAIEKNILKIKGPETTWVRIVFNDSLADEVTFHQGDVREWTSHSEFYLRIGNAGGIELELNGRNMGKPGRQNQITNIVVDDNGPRRIPYSSLPVYMFNNVKP